MLRKLSEGLKILNGYPNTGFPIQVTHGELKIDVNPELVSVDDKNRLDVLGFCIKNNLFIYTNGRGLSC